MPLKLMSPKLLISSTIMNFCTQIQHLQMLFRPSLKSRDERPEIKQSLLVVTDILCHRWKYA